MKYFLLIIATILATFTPAGRILAATNTDKAHVIADTPWFDPTDGLTCSGQLSDLDTPAPSGAENKETIWNNLVAVGGFKPFQAAGIMGNMQSESHFDPTILQKGGNSFNPADAGGGGYGLVQWTPGSKLVPYLHNNPLNASNVIPSEIRALVSQLNGVGPSSEQRAGDALKASTNVKSASDAFELKYERHAGGAQPARAKQAQAILDEAIAKNWLDANSPDASGTTAGNTLEPGSNGCTTNVTTTDGCTNPFSAGHFELHRTDDGVDYAAKSANQPLLAICDMTIIRSSDAPGWGPGSSFIYAKLTSGPFAGKCWYYSEHLDKGDLPPAGKKLKAGDHVATLVPGGWDLEVGFARGDHLAATSVGEAGYPSVSGIAAAKFIRSLGGTTRDNPGSGPITYGGGSCP